ncbi:unnamed protein product [Symbiodinium sp. CCMP2592]|nr:unnamed protein product [Symbiodinium sp. CCMP2592]
MPTNPGDGESSGLASVSHLPWQQIPRFQPGTTNVDEYTQRLRFLRDLWPEDQLHLLAPRAALQVEGVAFQKIARLDPAKLRSKDGIKLLVETLGGSWGKTKDEEKYFYFEQAIYQTNQRVDETNDSYISRHDTFFEELLTRNVTINEIRAYILLRNSQLSPEDKKRVIVESAGDLKYEQTIKAIRLLGSKFFQELQGRNASTSGTQGRGMERTKVYDIHMNEADETEDVQMAASSGSPEDEPTDLCFYLENQDEDAIYARRTPDAVILVDDDAMPRFGA